MKNLNENPRDNIRREDGNDNNTEGTHNRGFQGSGSGNIKKKKGLSLPAKIGIGVLIALGIGLSLVIFL